MILGAIGARSRNLRFFQAALDRRCPDRRIGPVCAFDAPELAPELEEFDLCPTPEEVIARADAVLCSRARAILRTIC